MLPSEIFDLMPPVYLANEYIKREMGGELYPGTVHIRRKTSAWKEQELVSRLEHNTSGQPLDSCQSVFRNAISALRSSSDKFNPNGWPFTAYVFTPNGLNPVGT